MRTFLRWAEIAGGAAVLDMGCGPGVSTALIGTRSGPLRLYAFDFDPAMVARARRRLGRREDISQAHLAVADASRLPYRSDAFDAVFETGVVHHVPDWRSALREAGRVLRPGGRFCFAEPSRGRLRRGLYRMLPHAPESMFDVEEWREALAAAGLALHGTIRRMPLWDICGVATKL
jgi:ubiquinone/menaquinone biosynthesis C-methylase UbiE